MKRQTKLKQSVLLMLLLVSSSTQAVASDQQMRTAAGPPAGPSPSRRVNVCIVPRPPMVPAFGDNNLFSSAVKKHANGDLEGAIAGYMAAIKVQDKDPAVHWYLGTAYEAVGKSTDAKREFEKSVQ